MWFFFGSYWILLFRLGLFKYFLVPFKNSHYVHLFFSLNSINIFINNVLNSLPGKLFISVSLFVFLGFFSLVPIESSSSAFLFCLTFSVTVNLGETVTSCGLEGVFWCGSILIQTACAQCLHWESWIPSDIPSAGGGAGAGCEADLCPCPVAGTLLGQDLIQVDGGKGRAQAGSVPCGCVFSPLPALEALPQSWEVLTRVAPTWTLCRQRSELSACRSCTCSLALLTRDLMCMSPLPLTAHHCAQPPPVIMGPPCRVPGACVESLGIFCGSCGVEAAVRVLGSFWCATWVSANRDCCPQAGSAPGPGCPWIVPTQGSNPGLRHCRWILYHLSHQGSPRILEWVAYLFSRGSSQPRNQTGVSCIAGGFFTNWAIREAQIQHQILFLFRFTSCVILAFTFRSVIHFG